MALLRGTIEYFFLSVDLKCKPPKNGGLWDPGRLSVGFWFCSLKRNSFQERSYK